MKIAKRTSTHYNPRFDNFNLHFYNYLDGHSQHNASHRYVKMDPEQYKGKPE